MEIDLQEQNGIKVFFIHLGTGALSWYRIVQFAQELAKKDEFFVFFPEFLPELHDKELREFELNPDKYISYFNKIFEIADIVVCQSVHNTYFLALLQTLKEIYKVKLIIESDDDPFEIDADHQSFKNIGYGSKIENDAHDQIKISDYCILSTDYLNWVFSYYKDKEKCFTIPNCLNFNVWDNLNVSRETSDKIILGWAGASNHEKNLNIVLPVLYELLEKIPNLYIKTLHGGINRDSKPIIDHPRFENVFEWVSIEDYPQKLADMNFDIAIAPLWDSEFNRSKSNLRYLQYSALKIPCVASNVEPYKKSIVEGVDGFLASTKKEWLDKISKLVYNLELRKKIATNAYKKVKKNFNLTKVTQNYADLLKDIYNKEVSDVNVSGTAK